MIKSELIAHLCKKMTHLTEKNVTDSVNEILNIMSKALIEGQRIEIRGFGSFALHKKAARNAHNPKTGEKVTTKDKKSAHFKAGKELRDRVNASRQSVPIRD